MSILSLEEVFEGFSDAKTPQSYDEDAETSARLERLKQSYRDVLADIDKDDVNTRASAGAVAKLDKAARKLAADLDRAVTVLVSEIVPSAQATANTDFVIEDSNSLPVTFETRMAQFRDVDGADSAGQTLRVANLTLEQNFQSLLDHLTAKRISEEMDTPTYIERLRGGFKRVHDGSIVQSDKLDAQKSRADRTGARLWIAEELVRFLREEVVPEIAGKSTEHDEDIADQTERLAQFIGHSRAYARHLQGFLAASIASLTDVHQKFCSEGNMAGVEGETRLVSAEIERHAIFRPLPLLWALVVTFLSKVVLAHNTSETLHYQAVPILVLTFVLTWLLSVYAGVWARNRRMKTLQTFTGTQLRQLLRSDDADAAGFPAVGADVVADQNGTISAFSFRGNAASYKRQVIARNLFALIIPALLAMAVLITRKEVEHDFIARFPDSGPCVMASGHLVFATQSSYFVQPSTDYDSFGGRALSRVFPELMAEVIERSNIISVQKFVSKKDAEGPATKEEVISNQEQGIAEQSLLDAPRTAERLRDCVEVDPRRNRYTIAHNGNALGALGTQTSFNLLSERTNQLIEVLNRSRPINLDLGGTLPGNGAAVTVNLGDTSLDILTQAIGSGGSTGSFITNPQIIEARASIELELSKPDQGDIDIGPILVALNQIRQELGDDATLTQAINVAFGGNTIAAPNIEIPQSLQLFLAGQNGEGGLPGELKNLRIAIEESNQLAAIFAAALPEGEDREVMMTLLTDQLGLVMEKQDALIAVLSAGLSTQQAPPLVVTPVILDPDFRGGGTAPGSVTQSIFQTTIEVAGQDKPISTLGNTLVLPFFTEPVSDPDIPTSDPQRAFGWGADTGRLKDPVVARADDQDVTYFRRIADTLDSCLSGDVTIEMDMIGLSSRSWDGPTGDFSKDLLNYNLAEGRRLGALRMIGGFIENPDKRSRLLVQTAGDELASLADILAFPQPEESADAFLRDYGRFATPQDFEARRETLLSVVGLSETEKSPLEELFARSVVLRMISAEAGPCQF